MTDRLDGQRSPNHQRVFSLLGYSPSSTILAESCRDGLYLAFVESSDGSQADGVLLEIVDGEWSRLDEGASRDVARAVGHDPSRAGSTIRVVVKDSVFEESVSPGGWWAFVAKVNDHHLPENAIQLPGPAASAVRSESEPIPEESEPVLGGSAAGSYDLTAIEGESVSSRVGDRFTS